MGQKPLTKTKKHLHIEKTKLRTRLAESEEALNAIRNGKVDAIVVSGADGEKIFSLTSSETPYRIIVEEMNEGTAIVSADGVILYCNRRFAELVSTPLEKITGSNYIQFVAENDKPKYNDLLRTGFKKRCSGEITRLIHNSNPVHFYLSFSPLPPDMLGDVCIMAMDITELKQKEEELRRSHDTLEQRIIERTATLTKTLEDLETSRIAALKMVEDAVEAKKVLETANKNLIKEITERKQAEEALKESERFAKNTVNTLDVNLAIIDASGVILAVNKAWRAFNKENNGDPVRNNEGANYLEICDNAKGENSEGAAEIAAGIRAVISGKAENYKLEYPCNSPETKRWFTLSVTRFYGDGPVRVVISHANITDRKQAEEELIKYREHLEELVKERTNDLNKERNLLRTLIDSLPDEIYAKNKDSRYIIVNSNILRSFGLTNINDVIGKSDFEILPQKAAIKFYSTEHAVLLAEGKMINYEETFPDADGNLRWYSITKVPMKDEEGNITGLVGINRDITYFKESEERLEKAKTAAENANFAKSTFLSSMSHEIRTPLNAILGFSELMQGDDKLSKEHKNWLRTINRSGEHLLALINDILEVSRIEAGRITFNPSTFGLHALLRDIEAMFRVKTDKKNLSLLFEYSDELPKFVVTDEGKLRQIIINLVGNAVKFTKEGGVAFRAYLTHENNKMHLAAEIEDTGLGIAVKDIDKLFQKFGQTEAGIKEGGTGLGLAISQQYAKIMGGEITVKSEEGKGSNFTLTIEIENSEILIKDENHKKKVIGLKPGQKLYRILVSDDHTDSRDLLKILLISVGFGVEEAQNGREAIEKFKIWSPDLILMDMQMPVMDGYEATREIKAMENGKIQIIAVTASAFQEDMQKALEAGADAYLRKPLKEYELFEHIETCLGVQYVYE